MSRQVLQNTPYIERQVSFQYGEVSKLQWANIAPPLQNNAPKGDASYTSPAIRGAKIIENMRMENLTSLTTREGSARLDQNSTYQYIIGITDKLIVAITGDNSGTIYKVNYINNVIDSIEKGDFTFTNNLSAGNKFQVVSTSETSFTFKKDYLTQVIFKTDPALAIESVVTYSAPNPSPGTPPSGTTWTDPSAIGAADNSAFFNAFHVFTKGSTLHISQSEKYDLFRSDSTLVFPEMTKSNSMIALNDTILIADSMNLYTVTLSSDGSEATRNKTTINGIIENGLISVGSRVLACTKYGMFEVKLPNAFTKLEVKEVTTSNKHFFDVEPMQVSLVYENYNKYRVLRKDGSVIEFKLYEDFVSGTRFTFAKKITMFPYSMATAYVFSLVNLALVVDHRSNDDNFSLEAVANKLSYSPYLFLDDASYRQSIFIGHAKRSDTDRDAFEPYLDTKNFNTAIPKYAKYTVSQGGGNEYSVVIMSSIGTIRRAVIEQFSDKLIKIKKPSSASEGWGASEFDHCYILGVTIEVDQSELRKYQSDADAVLVYLNANGFHTVSILDEFIDANLECLYYAVGYPYRVRVKTLNDNLGMLYKKVRMKLQYFGGSSVKSTVWNGTLALPDSNNNVNPVADVHELHLGSIDGYKTSYPNIDIDFQKGTFSGLSSLLFLNY